MGPYEWPCMMLISLDLLTIFGQAGFRCISFCKNFLDFLGSCFIFKTTDELPSFFANIFAN